MCQSGLIEAWLRLCRGKVDHLGSAPIDWWTTTVHETDGSANCWPFTGVAVLGCGKNVTSSPGTHWGDWRPLWFSNLVAVMPFLSANTQILLKVSKGFQSIFLHCMLIRQSKPWACNHFEVLLLPKHSVTLNVPISVPLSDPQGNAQWVFAALALSGSSTRHAYHTHYVECTALTGPGHSRSSDCAFNQEVITVNEACHR